MVICVIIGDDSETRKVGVAAKDVPAPRHVALCGAGDVTVVVIDHIAG